MGRRRPSRGGVRRHCRRRERDGQCRRSLGKQRASPSEGGVVAQPGAPEAGGASSISGDALLRGAPTRFLSAWHPACFPDIGRLRCNPDSGGLAQRTSGLETSALNDVWTSPGSTRMAAHQCLPASAFRSNLGHRFCVSPLRFGLGGTPSCADRGHTAPMRHGGPHNTCNDDRGPTTCEPREACRRCLFASQPTWHGPWGCGIAARCPTYGPPFAPSL